MENELTTTRTLEVIGAEIRTFTASMLNNIIEIGRRMCEAKELTGHGDFMGWIKENTGYSQSTANNFMKLYQEYGDRQGSLFGAELSNSQTFGNLTYSKALALLALPSGEREEFVESHAVDDMTTRELQDAIARAKELEKERDDARRDEAAAKKTIAYVSDQAQKDRAARDEALARVKELEERPVEVAVQVDEEAVKKAADEARAAAEAAWSEKVKAAEEKLAVAEEKAKKAEKANEKVVDGLENDAAEAKREADRLREELATLRQEQKKAAISGDAELAAFQLLFESAQGDVNKMHGILLKVRGRDEELAEKLTAALLALADKVKECAA